MSDYKYKFSNLSLVITGVVGLLAFFVVPAGFYYFPDLRFIADNYIPNIQGRYFLPAVFCWLPLLNRFLRLETNIKWVDYFVIFNSVSLACSMIIMIRQGLF